MKSLMQPLRGEGLETPAPSSDDELGRLLRWGLRQTVGAAEPPEQTWHRILDRVRRAETTEQPPRRASASLPSLVQAAVIGCLLLTLGLGLERDVILARNQQLSEPCQVAQDSAVAHGSQEDLASAPHLARRELANTFRRGGEMRDATLPS